MVKILCLLFIILSLNTFSQATVSGHKKKKEKVIKVENDLIAKSRLIGLGIKENEVYFIPQNVIYTLNRYLVRF